MNKPDLVAIVDTILSVWPTTDIDPKTMYATWWRYLADLDTGAVQAAIDAAVIDAAPWRPKVGEIRRTVIDAGSPWPTPDGAWQLAESRRGAADTGIDPDPLTAELATALTAVMRATRGTGKTGFCDAWRAATATRYSLDPTETT